MALIYGLLYFKMMLLTVIPVITFEKIEHKRIMYPALTLFKTELANVPTINMGPALEQKTISFCTSMVSSWLSQYKSDAIFAPNGYPDKIPNKNTINPFGFTLNIFPKDRVKNSGKTHLSEWHVIIFTATIKGKSEGITLLNHAIRPLFAKYIVSFG